jgi:hypothetical protein
MKNFPHQFNDLEKLSNALAVAKQLIHNNTPLTDENFGEQLTREGIYTYRDKTLSIGQFLQREKQKPKSNRGYLTVSRDIRRFLELLGFIVVLDSDKNSRLTTIGKQLLTAISVEQARQLWKNALLQLGLEGTDEEISHPYRILLKIVNTFPGVETTKLMLALEAKNDSEEEPKVPTRERSTFREVSAENIAKDPTIKVVSSVSIDISDAIKTRQKRLAEHQEIVRLLAMINEKFGIQLFEGKFDCLGIKGDTALLYEVKTILESAADQEKQTVKGVGQLKYYKFSVVQQQMELSDIKEILVFSRRPDMGIIDFCTAENIAVIWRDGGSFQIFNVETGGDDSFNPDGLP